MGKYLPCFKAYDVRGVVPDELNPEIAYAIGRAYAHLILPKKVCIGYDIRLSGPELYRALAKGLNDGGVDVSTDGGKSWVAPPLPISQCYHVSADTRTPSMRRNRSTLGAVTTSGLVGWTVRVE